MAKKSVTARNKKRIRMVKNNCKRRHELKLIIQKNPELVEETTIKLQKRRRDESPIRIRNRCRECGRSNGTLRKFGLCRIHLCEAAMRGEVPGLRKASW